MITEKLIFKIPYEIPESVCSAEGLAFISAHETATGLTMGDIQKGAVCGFIDRLKGNGTTNGSDIWTTAVSRGARMWIHCPTNDSTISFNGCNIELFSQTTLGTFNNFLSGDLTVFGLKGGTTKYFDTNKNIQNYGNNCTYGVYVQDNIQETLFECGQDFRNYMLTRDISNRFQLRIGGTSTLITNNTNSQGLFSGSRSLTVIEQHKNGVLKLSGGSAYSTDIARTFPFHAYVVGGSYSTKRQSIYFLGLPYMSANEHADLYEAIQWYQTNVITGGRNV